MQNKTVMFFLLFVLSISSAIDLRADGNVYKVESLSSGTWAVQFSIGENLTLRNFDSQFSIKRHLRDDSALRLGFDLNQRYSTKNQPNLLWDDQAEQFDISFSLAYIRYPRPLKRIKFYWGLGPIFGYSHDHDISGYASRKTNEFQYGVVGIFGFEWFAIDELSIHAEYQPRFSYTDQERISRPSNYKETIGTWSTYADRVIFGLSVYF